ncbi:MAG: hypothetical protein F4Y02_15500 [Chloroflexi bacterium]|nr:hypothetical protein [Chloroflexota bacterium]
MQANARQYFAGLSDFLGAGDTRVGTADPTVTPRHRDSALVTTAPSVTFSSITTGRLGNWDRTSFSHRGGTFFDRIDVYSDAEAPDHVPFRDSVYNDGTAANEVPHTSDLTLAGRYGGGTAPSAVVDTEGDVVGSLSLSGDTVSNVVVSPFPRSGDPAKSFTRTDRGQYDAARRNDPAYTDDDQHITNSQLPTTHADYQPPPTYRNMERYPLRYTYEQSGSLAGASGTFTCASDTATDSCSVTNQNNHFLFTGAWFFTPSTSARVRVDDDQFMYFGWWARQTNNDGTWDFRTFYGPGTAGNRSGDVTALSGSATYSGPAVGQFSFYQPLTAQSEYGEFSATATLRVNFDNNMVDGTIDQFDNHPDWTLTLNHSALTATDGTVAGTADSVSWQIDGEAVAAPDSGTWEAALFSNLPAAQRAGTVPTGIAGSFEAAYHNVGAIIGAFGAHKQP